MLVTVVIDMKNPNALISMAIVSQNADNPYSVFCEYIKYCIFTNNTKPRTIENDAYSLWETHMRRAGNYSEYCGTNLKLPVFVTTNSRLIGVALGYRNARPSTKEIFQWKSNQKYNSRCCR